MKIKNIVEGLNAQQRSVPQLPAQAQARHISVLGAKTDPKHPFAGYMVGADESAEPGKKSIGPDQNDPYEKGWRARPDAANPYAAGTSEHAEWQDGRDEREAQPDHYKEEVDLSEKLGALRPKLGTGHDVGKSVRKWRRQRGLLESDTQDKTDSNFFRKFSNLIAEAEQQVTEVTRRDFLKASAVAAILSSTPVAKLMSNAPGKMSIVKHRGNLGKYQSSDIDSTGYDIGKKQFYITVDGKPYTVQTGIGAGFMGQDFKNSDFKPDPYLQKIAPWLDTKDEYILQIADYDIELYDQNNQKIFPVKDQQQMKEMYSSGLIDAIIGFSDVYQTDAIQQMAKVPNKPNYPVDQGDQSTDSKSARPTTGMSGLARAAGAQIGRTATKLGKATANTVLNQPARDMGRIEPTMSPIALPAPSVSPGMQIPKQKSRVAAKQDKEGVAEGKPQKRADRYHINKDGKPASLASYADRASAVKDRDAKYPDAKVHQVGPRGKVKGEFEEGMAEEFDSDNNPWRVTDVDPMSETDFEVALQGPGGQQLNFVIRPVDFMETRFQRYQIDTMDVRDLQTGKTMHWGSMNDLGQWEPIFDAIDTYFWESPALQARLEKIISYYMDAGEQGKNPDMMPGLDQRDPNGVAVSADDFIASHNKTQDAMSKMKKGVAEDSIEEDWKRKLAGAALAGAAAFGGGGAQAQTTAPTGVNATGNNAAIVQSLVNPVAQQRFAKMHADTTAKLTDPRYTHNPDALAQHQAAPKQTHAEWIENVKNAAEFNNPYQIIRIALNMAGVTPQEVLQNLPKGYKLPTTEPKTAPVRLPGDPGYVREGAGKEADIDEGLKRKLAGAVLAGAAALGGGAAAAHDHGDYGHYDQRVDDRSWVTAGYDDHIKSDTKLTKTTTPDGKVSRDSQSRISSVQGPNAQGEYRVFVGQNGKIVSSYITKTPPQNWMVKEGVTKEDIITKLKTKLGDYLSDIGQEIRKDPDLINKLAAKPAGNQMGPPVKTVTTDDGHEISIHGNEDDGFRISIKNRQTPSQFKNLDEAVMACEMYCARRRQQAVNADYVEEA